MRLPSALALRHRPAADSRDSRTIQSRADWIDFADDLLDAYGAFRDPACPWNVRVPGRRGAHGERSDALEGFTRRLLILAFRCGAGDRPPADAIAQLRCDLEGAGLALARGEAAAWPSAADSIQANVEAAGIAIGLAFAREELWDGISDRAARGIADWMRPVAARRGDENNWVLFGACVEAFFDQTGGERRGAIEHAYAATDAWYRGDGWYGDGPRMAFDYYNAWSFHFYLPLIARLTGDAERQAIYRERLAAFLPALDALVDSQGRPVAWGRSLTYRFGMLAPLWVDQLSDTPAGDPGRARELTFAAVNRFLADGALRDGLLTVGWRGADERVAQDYSGAASPLWAAKAFAGLLLPADHPAWVAPRADSAASSAAPFPAGEILPDRGTGVARLFTDGLEGWAEGVPYEDPFYNRLAYSSATLPLRVDGTADNSIESDRGECRTAIADFDGVELRASYARGRVKASGWPTAAGADPELVPLFGFGAVHRAGRRHARVEFCEGSAPDGRYLLATRLVRPPGSPPLAECVRVAESAEDHLLVDLPAGRRARVEFVPAPRIDAVG